MNNVLPVPAGASRKGFYPFYAVLTRHLHGRFGVEEEEASDRLRLNVKRCVLNNVRRSLVRVCTMWFWLSECMQSSTSHANKEVHAVDYHPILYLLTKA